MGAIKFTDNISQLGTIVGEVGNLLDAPEMVRPNHDADIHDLSIQFQDVSFSYDLKDPKPILDHINLTIQPGNNDGFSRAFRFRQVNDYQIDYRLLGGYIRHYFSWRSGFEKDPPVRSFPLMCLMYRRTITSVTRASVKTSVWGRLSATDQEVEDVARKCGCHDFIMDLEHGYDTIVGGAGGHLSGG